jgi:hypothetical protein
MLDHLFWREPVKLATVRTPSLNSRRSIVNLMPPGGLHFAALHFYFDPHNLKVR